jgi:hypothetical protein
VLEKFDHGKMLTKTLNIEQLVLSVAGLSCIESLHRFLESDDNRSTNELHGFMHALVFLVCTWL